MSKYCFNCKSNKIEEITKNNRKLYFCNDCKKTEERFYSDEDGLFVINTKSGPKHVTVGAVIRNQNNEMFLIKRRVWPFCYSLVVGHLEYGESSKDALKREIIEESGMILRNAKLIYHGELSNDPCRYGVDLHEWYLYETIMANSSYFLNSESESGGWFTINKALKLKLTEPTRYLLENLEKIKSDKIKNVELKKRPLKIEHGDIFTEEKRDGVLFHISQALFKTRDLASVLRVAVREVLHAIDAEISCIYLYDQRNNDLYLADHTSKPASKKLYSPDNIQIGQGTIGQCAQNRQVAFNYDFKNHTKTQSEYTTVAIPMVSGNNFFGVISVSSKNKSFFTETEIQFLNILSSQICSAISNVKAYDELKGKIQSLSKLFGITSIYSKQTKQSVQRMLEAIPALLDCQSTILLLADNHKKEFYNFGHSGESHDKEKIEKIILPFSEASLSREVFMNKQPIICNSIDEKTGINKRLLKLFDIESSISVPVLVQDNCLGVLNIYNKTDDQFTEEDVKLLSVAATHIGSKIENNQLSEKTRSEKELLDRIIEGISDGVVVLDKQGKIITWNAYIEEITNLYAEDVLNFYYREIFSNKLGLRKISSTIDNFCHDINRSRDITVEEEMINRSGEKIWLNASFSCLRSTEYQAENTIIVLRNISKEKNLIQVKNEFITTTAHELRTPLTSVTGYLSMILAGDAGKLNNKQTKYFTKAYASTERLTHLVEELLEVLRIEEDKIVLDIHDFNINKLIPEVIDNLKSKAKNKAIKINFINRKPLLAHADRVKTKHIIENIVDNAIKYTGNNGEITINTEKKESSILISIKDSGVGIKKEYIKKIFDRFVRAPNKLSIKAGGTGLGLFIAKKLINYQQGEIWVESENNKGATFYISLPSFIK